LVENSYLATHDLAARGMTRSGRALQEVKFLKTQVDRIEGIVDKIDNKLGPLGETLGRLDENMQTLLGRRSSARPADPS
jgi:hypothetical protein